MATIGNLQVNIVATTDKFITGLNQAQTGLGRFVKKIGTVHNAVVGLGAVAFASLVKSTLDAGGALFDLAQKLNISTEALGALDYAAQQLGVSTNAMHNSLSILTRKLGEAQTGSKSARQAFANLGIDFQQLLGLPVEQQFLGIVDALNKIPGAEQRASAAAAIFGKSSKEMTALIAAGSTEISRFGDEAAKAGILVSTETAAAMDNASDSIARFQQAWAGLKMNIVGDYAPEIELALDGIGMSITALRAGFVLGQGAIVTGAEMIVRVLRSVVQSINMLLPKSMEFSTQLMDTLVDEFANKRRALRQNLDDITLGREGQGPLQAPAPTSADQKQVARNTATTNDKLDELIREQRANRGATLAPAGVR